MKNSARAPSACTCLSQLPCRHGRMDLEGSPMTETATHCFKYVHLCHGIGLFFEPQRKETSPSGMEVRSPEIPIEKVLRLAACVAGKPCFGIGDAGFRGAVEECMKTTGGFEGSSALQYFFSGASTGKEDSLSAQVFASPSVAGLISLLLFMCSPCAVLALLSGTCRLLVGPADFLLCGSPQRLLLHACFGFCLQLLCWFSILSFKVLNLAALRQLMPWRRRSSGEIPRSLLCSATWLLPLQRARLKPRSH